MAVEEEKPLGSDLIATIWITVNPLPLSFLGNSNLTLFIIIFFF